MDFGAMVGAPSGGERQAALLLHSMAPADRDWALRALPARRREQMAELLAELQALQIAPDAALVRAAVAPSSHAEHATQTRRAHVDDRSLLRGLSAELVAALAVQLQREPARLAAQCLALEAWPWRATLLAQLPARQRQEIGDHLLSAGIAPPTHSQLASTLLRLLREHCEAAPSQSAGPAAPRRLGWLQRFVRGRR